MPRAFFVWIALPVSLTLAGCATTDSNMSNSVYATHRIVRNLESDIGPSVAQLNETAAQLVARVEASDQENRALRAVIEENQAKIDSLQQQVSNLTSVVYRQFGLTQPQGASGGGLGGATSASPAQIVPPSASPQPQTNPAAVTPIPNTVQSTMPATTQVPATAVPVQPAPVESEGSSMLQEAAGVAAQTPVSEDTARVDYISAQKAFIDENYEDALQRYNEYLTRYPTGADAHNAQFWKAECYRRVGQYENAIREYEYLEQRYGNQTDNNKLPLAMQYRAEAYLSLGQTERGTEILKELIAKYPMSGVVDSAKSRLRSIEGE